MPPSAVENCLSARLLPHLTLENLIAGAALTWVPRQVLSLVVFRNDLRFAISFDDLLVLRVHGALISLQGRVFAGQR